MNTTHQPVRLQYNETPAPSPFYINPKKWVFNVVFYVAFTLSGLLTIFTILVGGFQYRMGLISLAVVPLFLLCRWKINGVAMLYGLLVLTILLSGLVNGSTVTEIVLFLRILGFSYLIYWLTRRYVNPRNATRILKRCLILCSIQLPIILIQRFTYDLLPSSVRARIIRVDIGFGTFNFKGDAALSFFCLLLVTVMLFSEKYKRISRYPLLSALWLTLTVFIANSVILHLVISFIWIYYIATHLNKRSTMILVSAVCIAFVVLSIFTPLLDYLSFTLNSVRSNLDRGATKEQSFFSGGYGRGAAISYYLSRPLLVLGDGPSAYYNPTDRSYVLGNTGHLFTFYSEIGILGLGISFIILLLMAVPIRRKKLHINRVSMLSFASIIVLSLTTHIMNDISVMFAYCIVTMAAAAPPPGDVHSVVISEAERVRK